MTSEFAIRGVSAVDDLGVAATLAAAGEAMAARHAAEVRALEIDLHFAALHCSDPGPVLAFRTLAELEAGRNKLVQLGGDGTPQVQDLPICELGIARGVHATAARHHLADALDLAHRLPGIWAALRAGRGEVWVARRVAALSRHLDREQVRQVDAAVSAALEESPGRVLTIAEAAVMRADPEHARRVDDERRRRRCLVLGRSDDEGLRKVFGLIDAGDAAWLDAMLERVADALESRPDLCPHPETCRDELRAEALGWLAHPDDVIALLGGTYRCAGAQTDGVHADETAPSPTRQRAVAYVHVSEIAVAALLGGQTPDVLARVEQLGPMLTDQVRRLVGHAHIDLKPVIDLNSGRSVNGYEHPADVVERGFLRAMGDVFPHAQSQSRRLDNDHPVAYDDTGPPGQTGDHNHAPLGRRHHRAKTHLAYRVTQLGAGRYVWRTPHGLCRLVDGTGTHVIDAATAQRLIDGS